MRIIIAGFGSVGQNLVKILLNDRQRFVTAYGFRPSVVAVIDRHGYCLDDNGLDLDILLRTKVRHGTVAKYPGDGERSVDSISVIKNTQAEVVVESTTSNFRNGEPGLSNIKTALSTEKHVVTTNKGPLALAMPVLLELADHRNLRLKFSGTVGAGTPFLDFAKKCLPGEKITGIRGILNGTSNYILTRMETGGVSLKKALVEAQAKGYAEADPSNDIDGLDTAAKLVIISNWILKRKIHLKDLDITGIVEVAPDWIKKAERKGRRVKLLGTLDDSVASVKPEEISVNDPICVRGSLNALTYSTLHAGSVTLIGPGAGGEKTASAVIRDLVDIRGEYTG